MKQYWTGAAVTLAAVLAVTWLADVQARRATAAGAAAVATWTATPRAAGYAVGDRVEGQATATPASEREARLWRIIDDLEARLAVAQERALVVQEEGVEGAGAMVAGAASPAVVAAPAAAPVVPAVAVDVMPAALSVWEDGSGCWTPENPVLHLCGAAASDGYVLRWVGVAGDNRGPEIADADWLAVRGGGDRLVWAGVHPGTGEAVTVNYWAAGHTLAVHAAGRLLFRIDRLHGVERR